MGRLNRFICRIAICLAASFATLAAHAEALPREEIESHIRPPYALGEEIDPRGVWNLHNSGGGLAGYAFETSDIAPLPGFSGAPIDLLVLLDLEGRFIDVTLLKQHEPVFVSGLGEAPFIAFLEQYRGLSIDRPMTIGSAYGASASGGMSVLDGVTKATASVRIAHESILAAALEVVRDRMKGIRRDPPSRPDPDHQETLTWTDLVTNGLVTHLVVTNAEVNAAFAGTRWAEDDATALEEPEAPFIDLWLVDIGPPAVARAVLDPDALSDLGHFLVTSPDSEPVLLIEAGRHGLVSPDFVRNTTPDLLEARQDGLPLDLRDADLSAGTLPGVPEGTAMIMRLDRRLGFDPVQPWTLRLFAERNHGMLMPEAGRMPFDVITQSDQRFFLAGERVTRRPVWQEAIIGRAPDLIVIALFLAVLFTVLIARLDRLSVHRVFPALRLGVLAFVAGFIGWWAQGQLSIVTVLGVIGGLAEGRGPGFLLYDPVTLLVWSGAIAGFALWGRGLFCGWLCPYGALQEFADRLGRLLRLPRHELGPAWDGRLKRVKYGGLAVLVGVSLFDPAHIELAAELEPFKTAITTGFQREWYFVTYASLWLALGLFTVKPYCRYLCPLGAVMVAGGTARQMDWIKRRKECGTPCQLCRVRCPYAAIDKAGKVDYAECFQCLDCVTIVNDPKRCVPLVLNGKRRQRAPVLEGTA